MLLSSRSLLLSLARIVLYFSWCPLGALEFSLGVRILCRQLAAQLHALVREISRDAKLIKQRVRHVRSRFVS